MTMALLGLAAVLAAGASALFHFRGDFSYDPSRHFSKIEAVRIAAISKIGAEGVGAPIQARFLFRALRTSHQSMTVPPASR
jgi:hypothetical protein